MTDQIDKKTSLKEMVPSSNKRTVTKYLDFCINMALLGKRVFNSKTAENIFDINGVDKEKRYIKEIQELYLYELLKASTPNYKDQSRVFNFNKKEAVGWIVLEFDVEPNLSDIKNIEYTEAYISFCIGFEPTLVFVQDKTVYACFLFPNYPTTKDKNRLKKYIYFADVRTALTHSLNANWDVKIENYDELKEYKTIQNSKFKLYGHIYEIGAFQDVLDEYKQTSTFKQIIKQKQAYGGYLSGVSKRNKSLKERRGLVKAANKKKVLMSKERLEETVLHILDTEETPKLTIDNIVKTSKIIYDHGLSHKTVVKYLDEIKQELNLN